MKVSDIKRNKFAKFVESTKPEHWPEVDELPEADTSDLRRVFHDTVEVPAQEY